MPLFDYKCLSCRHEFELLVRGSSVPACPSCGSTTLEKQLSMFAVSSDGTQTRSAKLFHAEQRNKSKSAGKEREFYRHDHHDD
jgi:putative FmdB family regulatory protein